MADGCTAAAEQKKDTHRKGATGREVLDENVVELLRRVSRNGRLSLIKKILSFTLSMMCPMSHVIITVEPKS